MTPFSSLLLSLGFAFFGTRRLLQYLHIFQQEEYDGRRFLKWLISTRSFDKRLSATLIVLAAIIPFIGLGRTIACLEVGAAAVFVLFGVREKNPRIDAKKKLVLTPRARRIFFSAIAILLVFLLCIVRCHALALWIVLVQLIPFSLVVANFALIPVEQHIQSRIIRDASTIMAQREAVTIGITGSFGKTSVKHILGHILEMNAPTLYTPGSVNTLMGVSRIIREQLTKTIRYFIVEMGAYGVGSIEKLCGLTPPKYGVITAIGDAHYERFKTLNNVAQAKFELAEACLVHADGSVIVHQSVLLQDYAKRFVEKQRERFIICGEGAECDFIITSQAQTSNGLDISLRWKQNDFQLFAPLFGLHHAGNVVLAFATALALGVSADRAVAALRSVPQIKHRLEVKRQSDGTIYIDDGFNSNPIGFSSALELLDMLAKQTGARRILITPGIVELGTKHDETHYKLGAQAARDADVILVVRSDRIPTFVDGVRSLRPSPPVLIDVGSFAEAQAWLKEKGCAGDVILIENDLPDLGERSLSL